MFSPAGRRPKPRDRDRDRDRDGVGASVKPPPSTPFKPTSFFPPPHALEENEGGVFPASPSTPMHRLRLTSPGKHTSASSPPSAVRLSSSTVR